MLVLAACSSAPTPPGRQFTPAELEAQARADVESAQDFLHEQFPDAVVPEVERIRFIDYTEWAHVMVGCMTDAGWTVIEGEDGGMGSSPPDGQEEAFAIAQYVCGVQYPVDPRQTSPLNEEQLIYLYSYLTDVAVPCMEALGVTGIPDAPSQQTFVETYSEADAWYPYSADMDAEQWSKVDKQCPQIPPGMYD